MHGNLAVFHHLMQYVHPMAKKRAHPSLETYSYKCAAGVKSALVEYLLMRTWHLTEEETSPKTKEKRALDGEKRDGSVCGIADRLGVIRGLGEVVTCVYGPAVTYAFQDHLATACRHSVVYVSLISILDGTALNWCKQDHLRTQMIETVLFGKEKDPDLIVLNFRGQLQFRIRRQQEGPIEAYPKF